MSDDAPDLQAEIRALKKDVAALHAMLQILLQGGIVQNKRMDMLESFTETLSKLVEITNREITNHLDALREITHPPEPASPPAKASRSPEVA